MTGATSIAFAVFAGISLLVQIAPAFLRGVRRLELGTVRVNELNVLVKSPTSGETLPTSFCLDNVVLVLLNLSFSSCVPTCLAFTSMSVCLSICLCGPPFVRLHVRYLYMYVSSVLLCPLSLSFPFHLRISFHFCLPIFFTRRVSRYFLCPFHTSYA